MTVKIQTDRDKCYLCGDPESDHYVVDGQSICPCQRGDGSFGDDYDYVYDQDGYSVGGQGDDF